MLCIISGFLVLAAGKYLPLKFRAGIGFQPISPEELKMTSELARSRSASHHLVSPSRPGF